MRILFCQSISYPFVGVMSISAVLKEHGHKTKLKIFNISKPKARDLKEIEDYKPDIVAFPAYTGWQKSIIDFCRKFKEKNNAVIVLGGPHATYCPKVLGDDSVDYICVGEGERSFLNLVESKEKSKSTEGIRGIWYKNKGVIVDNGISELPDLDLLPPMDIDIYCEASEAIKNLTHREFSINRGCPYSCTYCNEPSLHRIYGGRNLRTKKADRTIEEISYVYDKGPFASIAFTSDNFFIKNSFLFDFLEKYKAKINIPFYCQMRAEFVTYEVAKILKASNCHYVTIGVESGSPRVRKEILGRQISNEQLIKACNFLREAGISVNVNNMMGIPGETVDEAWETISLNKEINPTTSWCSIFQPYPKSELTSRLISRGELSEEVFDDIPASYFEKSVLKYDKIYVFVNLQRFFYFAVKYPWLNNIVKQLSKVPPPLNRFFEIFFLLSFCLYVKKAYRKSFLNSFKTILVNAFEALNN